MGQINSGLYLRCSSHCLHTKHSEEGYCSLCDQRFSAVRGQHSNIGKPDGKRNMFDYSSDTERSNPPIYFNHNTSSIIQLHQDLAVCESSDAIFRCSHCPRFFYTAYSLEEHVSGLKTPAPMLRLDEAKDSNGFCHICSCAYTESSPTHLECMISHVQRPFLTWKECEIERIHNCCVRCGIYFKLKSEKQNHFADIAYHDRRIQSGLDTQEVVNIDSGTFDFEDGKPGALAATLRYPEPPSSVPVPALIPLCSSYTPELKSWGEDTETVTQDGPLYPSYIDTQSFECPLCLESEENIMSLSCGHVFCAACISQTLARDTRCPMCRAHVETREVRRVYLV